MSSSQEAQDLASAFLLGAVSQIESRQESNYFTIRNVGGICKLIGYRDLASRCSEVLRQAPERDLFQGAITNIPRSTPIPPMRRELDELEILEKDHPLCTDASLAEYVSNCGREQSSLRLAAIKKYEEAFAACKSELEFEEVALAQAVLGDIDAALNSAAKIVMVEMRRRNVQFVCTFELFRRKNFDAAQALLKLRILDSLTPLGAAQFALGIYQRIPWLGYPFPDW